MKKLNSNKILKSIYIFIFCLLIALPAFQLNTKLFNDKLLNEKREKAARPSLDLKMPFTEYAKAYDTYFNDNFGFRDFFITLSNTIDVRLFNKSTNEKVFIGTNNYLYHGDEMKDYNRVNTLSPQQIDIIARNLKNFQDKLAYQGIDLIFFIGPNKSTIYPEYVGVPPTFKDKESNYEMLTKALDKYQVNNFDAKSFLLQYKDKYDLYYKRDTHWNKLGAALIAKEMLRIFKEKHPITGDITIDKVYTKVRTGDLDELLGIQGNYEETFADISIEKSKTLLPKTVSYFDSFSYDVLPLLTDFASERIEYHTLNEPVITNLSSAVHDSKILYFEIVERMIPNLLGYDFNVLDDPTEILNSLTPALDINLDYDNNKDFMRLNDVGYQKSKNDNYFYVSLGNDSNVVWNISKTDFKYIYMNLPRVSKRASMQIFWNSEGEKFNEKRSTTINLIPGKKEYIIELPKEVTGASTFRIDIGSNRYIEMDIRNIQLYK